MFEGLPQTQICLFSDADLLEKFQHLESCPHDFVETLRVSFEDNWASWRTIFGPELTLEGRDKASSFTEFQIFFSF